MAVSAKASRAGPWLRRRAEDVAVALLGILFVAFLVQIAFRYLFNFPVGWTSEVTVIAWLYLVLWGSAFVLEEREEIRFDIFYRAAGRRTRIALAVVFSIALVVLYGVSIKGSWAYVAFMKVERTAYLKIPLNWLYSIYIVFLVAIIARYLFLLWQLFRGRDPEPPDAVQVSSGL